MTANGLRLHQAVAQLVRGMREVVRFMVQRLQGNGVRPDSPHGRRSRIAIAGWRERRSEAPAGDPATLKRLQFAYKIDTSLVAPLLKLPPTVVGDPPPSLAERDLLRGWLLGPFGGRIVAEVFLGMMFGDGLSYLSLDPLWTPRPGFALRDLVAYGLGHGDPLIYR